MPLTIRRRLVDRIRQWRKIAYAVCAGLVILAGAVVFLSISSPASSMELASGPTFFEGNRTFRLAEDMWRFYPQRTLGSDDAVGATTWLAEKFSRLGIPPETDTFKAPLGDQEITLRNVAVVLPGASKETILVTAPRDTPTIVKVDPLAFTSGTAILADLVQVFAARPHQKTLVFLSTEDGSNGGLGIDRFLETSPLAADVTTVLSFQGLGKERARSLRAGVTASQNTTPGWYVQLTGRVLAKAGLNLQVPGMLSQAADHALSLSRGEQVAGLSRGIASLMLYDEGPGNPTAAGLSTQGAAIERLILSLDTGTEAPPDPGTALLLKSGRYLTERAVTLLAILMLFPTIAALLIWLFSSRVTGRAALMHLRNLLSFALPLAVTFVIAFLLARLGLIPRYRFQVPTIAGPATQARLAPTLILILIGLATFFVSRHFLGYLRPREQRAATEMARLSTGFFSLLIGLALMLSRSPFLLLPCLAAAWAWPLATCFAEPVYTGAFWRHRFISNAPVLLLGLLAPIVLYAYVAVADGVGWLSAWWFLLVQTLSGAYGVRGPAATVFITAGFLVLLGVKRMRVVPIETLEVTDELSLLELPVPRARRKPRAPSRPPLSPWG
ncbi:MAG: hypothetical protein V1912_12510 [bacterium]